MFGSNFHKTEIRVPVTQCRVEAAAARNNVAGRGQRGAEPRSPAQRVRGEAWPGVVGRGGRGVAGGVGYHRGRTLPARTGFAEIMRAETTAVGLAGPSPGQSDLRPGPAWSGPVPLKVICHSSSQSHPPFTLPSPSLQPPFRPPPLHSSRHARSLLQCGYLRLTRRSVLPLSLCSASSPPAARSPQVLPGQARQGDHGSNTQDYTATAGTQARARSRNVHSHFLTNTTATVIRY